MQQNLCRLSKLPVKSCTQFLSPIDCKSIASVLVYVAHNIFRLSKGVIKTEEHLGHSFKKLHFLLEQTINQRLVELDLTTAQGHAIGYLTHCPEPPCARDIEMAFGLSHATVSGILSRLEAKGFIELRSDPEDRRVKRIYLLEKGHACSQAIGRHICDIERVMAENFTRQELELFRSFLKRAIDNLNNANREE